MVGAGDLIGSNRGRVAIVDEFLDDTIVVGSGFIRFRNRRPENRRKPRDAVRGNDIAGEGLARQRIANRRGEAGKVAGDETRVRHAPQECPSLSVAQE